MSGDGQSRENAQRSMVSTDRSILKPSSLASVKVKYWTIAVGQGVTASQGKTPSGQGCQTDRSVLKPSSLASVKERYWTIAVGQGVTVSQGKTYSGQTDRSTLKPSSLASVKANYWELPSIKG